MWWKIATQIGVGFGVGLAVSMMVSPDHNWITVITHWVKR